MKKLVLCTILLLLILGTTGCKKEEVFITADNVTVNTILVKANGLIQVATVEDFDKTYYKLGELEEFVANEIDAYNKTTGEANITIDDVQLRGGKAIVLLSYTGMDQYAAFNNATAAYFNGGIEGNPLDLPATLVSVKNGSLASTEEVLSNSKYKILVLNEPYDIVVDGEIKYYSENALFVDENKVQSPAEGMTIVVFKP